MLHNDFWDRSLKLNGIAKVLQNCLNLKVLIVDKNALEIITDPIFSQYLCNCVESIGKVGSDIFQASV